MENASALRIIDLECDGPTVVRRLIAEEIRGPRTASIDGPVHIEPTTLAALQAALEQRRILLMGCDFFGMSSVQRLEALGAIARQAVNVNGLNENERR